MDITQITTIVAGSVSSIAVVSAFLIKAASKATKYVHILKDLVDAADILLESGSDGKYDADEVRRFTDKVNEVRIDLKNL